MPAPVRIEFQAVNGDDIKRVFSSAIAEAKKLEQQQARSARVQKQSAFAANDNAALKSERELAKYRKLSAMAEQAESRSVQARLRAKREELGVEKDKLALQRQQLALSEKEAASQRRESAARAKAIAREQTALARQARPRVGAMAGIVNRAGRSTLGTVTGLAGGLGVSSAGFMAADAVHRSIALEQDAAALVNSTRGAGGVATQNVGGLMTEAQGLAGRYGVDAGEVMKGMQIVAARAGGAPGLTAMRKDLEDLTQTAVAYKISMEDMGGVVAAALNAGVQPGEEMRAVVTQLVAQGKEGSVEFADLAQELARLAGTGRNYDMKGGAMISRMVGFAQIAARAQVSPEESRTAIKDIATDIFSKQDYLSKSGITLTSKAGGLVDPMTMMADIIEKAETTGLAVPGARGGSGGMRKGELGLGKIFTGTSRAVTGELLKVYRQGTTDASGNRVTGRAAVIAEIEKFSNAQLARGERDTALKTVMGTTGNQAQRAMQQFYADMSKLTPELAKLIPLLTQLATGLTKVAVWTAENPFKGLGIVFGAHLTKELAAVGLSSLVRSLFTQQVAQSGASAALSGLATNASAAGGSLSRLPGILGALGAVAAAGTAGYAAGSIIAPELIDPLVAATRTAGGKYQTQAGETMNKAQSVQRALRTMRPESAPATALQMAQELRAQAKSLQEAQNPSVWSTITSLGTAKMEANAARGTWSPEDLETKATELEAFAGKARDGTDALESFVSALKDATASPVLTNPANPRRGGTEFAPGGGPGGIY
jgi:hypothetical protein